MGGSAQKAMWKGEGRKGDVRVHGAERRLCAWRAVSKSSVPQDRQETEAHGSL